MLDKAKETMLHFSHTSDISHIRYHKSIKGSLILSIQKVVKRKLFKVNKIKEALCVKSVRIRSYSGP